MTFHILTIFPDFFSGPFAHGVVAKAIHSGSVQLRLHNLRDWTHDLHKTVDDRPFGGGEGMVFKPEPVFDAVASILPNRTPRTRVVLTSASGRLFSQSIARDLSALDQILIICGRYEGVDERIATHLADDELSIGDYVLSGGELPAAVIVDSVARLLPGVLGNQDSSLHESFTEPFLDCPHYTRPALFRGAPVPQILLDGNHQDIRKWRRLAALEKTARLRPDLFAKLSSGD